MLLLDQVVESWKLNDPDDRQMLHWAARMHEIGLDIALSGYQQHGAYLLEYSDMPGFPTGEQQVLACIVAGHRGKFSRNSFYDEIPGTWSRRSKRLTVLLRLAVLLNRSRKDDHATEVVLRAKGGKISVSVPLTLLDTGPLTWADLEREVKLLADADLELKLERLDESDQG